MTEHEMLEGASSRIEQHRKGEVRVQVVDQQGRPVPGTRVQVEQTGHAFLFGCNIFPLLGYAEEEQEAAYQQRFTDLLNYATLGFYWGGYEREPGKTRAAHLRAQAEWCRAHGLATKGHPLVWHEIYPKWAPREVEATRARLRARVTEIVSGFAGLVDRWDVVNEATVSAQHEQTGVGQWAKREGALALVQEALGWAHEASPDAFLLYNDFNLGDDFQQLARGLIESDAPVAAFGLQSHMHQGAWPLTRAWEACEAYAGFGKPLHFTEVTVLSGEPGWMRAQPWPSTPEGEARQAEYVADLYTTLFSHPAVEAITWWDLVDGAWQGAPAGLLRADLTSKPAYQRLLDLVRNEWWTRTQVTTGADGAARFRGFLGSYRFTTTVPAGTVIAEAELTPEGEPITITV